MKNKNKQSKTSDSTRWEKIFVVGDRINKRLKLTNKDVVDEVRMFRKNNDQK